MSKNTERGMGHQAGPVADDPPAALPRAPAERPAVRSGAADGGEGGSVRSQRSEIGQVTLLGVSAPVFDREKATAPGRDVHLPAEVRRAPAPRPVASEGGSPVALPPRRGTPDRPARTVVDPAPAQTMRISKTKLTTPVFGSVPEPSLDEGRAAFRVGRREPDPTDMDEGTDRVPTVGGSVVLGIGLSVVLALIVVGVARFGPRVRTAEPLPLQPFAGKPDPRLDPPGAGPAAADPAARDTTAAGQLPSRGAEPVTGNPVAPVEPPSSVVAGPAPEDVAPSGTPAAVAPREATPGSTLQAAAPDARTPPPVFDEIDDARPPNNLADKTVRRPAGRPRAVTAVGDRGAGPSEAGSAAAPSPRRSSGRATDGQSGSFGAAPGSGATPSAFAPPSSPSPFQPPPIITSPRAPPSKADEKAPYDPDSPLPPATE
jgi:hypothetical protein